MNVVPIQDVIFDDEATLAMGLAFDRACRSLRQLSTVAVREIVAKRIIEAAKNGERDPIRLCGKALEPFSIEQMPLPVISKGCEPPIPVHAAIAPVA
jgi:hypothetical protein